MTDPVLHRVTTLARAGGLLRRNGRPNSKLLAGRLRQEGVRILRLGNADMVDEQELARCVPDLWRVLRERLQEGSDGC